MQCVNIQIGNHKYSSRFVLGSTRYDVILGTPWHKYVRPEADYESNTVKIGDERIKGQLCNSGVDKVSQVSIKAFKKLLREKGTGIFACFLNSIEKSKVSFGKPPTDPDMISLIDEFSDASQSSLPKGLPPRRKVDHAIETDPNSKIRTAVFLNYLLVSCAQLENTSKKI